MIFNGKATVFSIFLVINMYIIFIGSINVSKEGTPALPASMTPPYAYVKKKNVMSC